MSVRLSVANMDVRQRAPLLVMMRLYLARSGGLLRWPMGSVYLCHVDTRGPLYSIFSAEIGARPVPQ